MPVIIALSTVKNWVKILQMFSDDTVCSLKASHNYINYRLHNVSMFSTSVKPYLC